MEQKQKKAGKWIVIAIVAAVAVIVGVVLVVVLRSKHKSDAAYTIKIDGVKYNLAGDYTKTVAKFYDNGITVRDLVTLVAYSEDGKGWNEELKLYPGDIVCTLSLSTWGNDNFKNQKYAFWAGHLEGLKVEYYGVADFLGIQNIENYKVVGENMYVLFSQNDLYDFSAYEDEAAEVLNKVITGDEITGKEVLEYLEEKGYDNTVIDAVLNGECVGIRKLAMLISKGDLKNLKTVVREELIDALAIDFACVELTNKLQRGKISKWALVSFVPERSLCISIMQNR